MKSLHLRRIARWGLPILLLTAASTVALATSDPADPEPSAAEPIAANQKKATTSLEGKIEAEAETKRAPKEKKVEVLSITGSRVVGRTATDSVAPIDLIQSRDLLQQGTSDMSEILRNLLPSFNVQSQPISDGSSFIRPMNLRGLAPDQTLVLVNGKRRHRAALVQLLGGSLAQGAQGVDIGNIPSIALERVEVLRDGASAQYGSDAIAGVINFKLREDTDLTEVISQYGLTEAGDGTQYKVALNTGTTLTEDGFINISLEVTGQDETSRGVQRPDAAEYLSQGVEGVPSPAMIWGSPKFSSQRSFWNGGLELSANHELYLFGNFSHTNTDGSFFYRNLSRSFFQDIPRDPTDPSQGSFNFKEWFPGGFTPRFEADINDFSQVLGYRGVLGEDLNFDLSSSVGRNHIAYKIRNTINPSKGPESPRAFKPGELVQLERNVNLDFSYPLLPVHLAFGFEFRNEQYEIREGDEASWEMGPYANMQDSANQPLLNPEGEPYPNLDIGSNGFPGYDSTQAGVFDRSSYASYADLEWDVSSALLLGVAGRASYFTDFGRTINGKVSGRYEVLDNLTLRATTSTGFRAPTPGQSHTTNVGTRFFDGNPTPVAVGVIPPTHAISEFFGAKDLKPESAVNVSMGVAWSVLKNLVLTLDAYNVDVSDRIALSSEIDIDSEKVASLQASGIERAADFGKIQFFTNAFDTRTQGVDVVVNYRKKSGAGRTSLNLGYNYNQTEVTDVDDEKVITPEKRVEIESMLPAHRVNLRIRHEIARFNLLLNTNYYSGWTQQVAAKQEFGPEVVMDAEVGYNLNDSLMLVTGLTNLLNTYPDKDLNGASVGRIYPENSPIGTLGRTWYLRASYLY